MQIIFFVKSSTVKIDNFNIKDIPGSSGRLDVISRCILAALFDSDRLERDIQIWIFLDKYGTYIFESNALSKDFFPISELKLSENFVELILKTTEQNSAQSNPLKPVVFSKLDLFSALNKFEESKYKIILLDEEGDNYQDIFSELNKDEKLLFIIGDQTGKIVNAEQFKNFNLINMSLGHQSYLASTVIRLIKLNLNLMIS
jgi:tRNA (pseudouridine54-N1)-methyltransferase